MADVYDRNKKHWSVPDAFPSEQGQAGRDRKNVGSSANEVAAAEVSNRAVHAIQVKGVASADLASQKRDHDREHTTLGTKYYGTMRWAALISGKFEGGGARKGS